MSSNSDKLGKTVAAEFLKQREGEAVVMPMDAVLDG
jgi:hypothetical protein